MREHASPRACSRIEARPRLHYDLNFSAIEFIIFLASFNFFV